MKKIKYIIPLILIIALSSCGEDYLDTEDLYSDLDENYYSNPDEIQEALTGAYSCLAIDEGINNPTLLAELMSDDRVGGGATNDFLAHAIDAFEFYEEDAYLDIWERLYQGIFRANMIISRFDQAEYDDVDQQNQDLGEAYFLRGYFYLKLAQLFGTVPLVINPEPVNLPRAEPGELFGQIASDFKKAIDIMPSTRVTSLAPERDGHATKWAAQGMMARAFLFYTGYYNQTEITLPEGGSVTSQNVVGWLDDCIQNSGHELVTDFRNLWPYAVAADTSYPYALDNNLSWAGDGNIETMFAVKYSPYADWNPPGRISYSNQLSLYTGLRGMILMPFGEGWGMGPVNPQLWDSFEEDDIRKQGSILNVIDDLPSEGDIATNYIWGGDLGDPQNQETGYWIKKYLPVYVYTATGTLGYFYVEFGGASDFQRWNMQDEVLLRFADVLLMAAELGSSNAQTYLDDIRSRAGLGSVAVTPENIMNERRHEFAGEGLRYYDLLRTHNAEAAFAEATGFTVYSAGVEETYTVTFDPARAFLKIPESQIRLSAGVLEQDEGWD